MNAVAGSGSPKEQLRQERRLATRVTDTYASSSIGGFLYLIAWLPIAAVTGLMERNPVACLAISLVFLFLAVLRLMYRPPQQQGEAQRRWLNRYIAIILLSVAAWSAMQAWVVFDPVITPLAKSVSLFGSVAFCTVLAHLYASSLKLSVTGVLLVVIPTTVALWMVPGLHLLAIAVTFFGGYLMTAIAQSQRDYRRRLELADALLDQRDSYELLSRTDGLTGLCNRRRFSEILNTRVWEQLISSSPVVNLMLMDIDHFKMINDRYGHIIGDEALKHFAERLRAEFGDAGVLLARTGGEEFAVISSDLDEESASTRADAFRSAIAAEPLQIAGLQIQMTVSIGVGMFKADLHNNDDGFYGAVDVALYAAKQEGRNRVVSVGTLDPVRSPGDGSLAPESIARRSVQESSGPCLN